MRIGQLAQQTGIPARMLRYYEEQGLIEPRRRNNGYRDYDEELVDRTHKIRCFLDAGVPTRALAPLLDSLEHPPDNNNETELGALLWRERDRMTQRIESLERSRASLTAMLDTMGWTATSTS